MSATPVGYLQCSLPLNPDGARPEFHYNALSYGLAQAADIIILASHRSLNGFPDRGRNAAIRSFDLAERNAGRLTRLVRVPD